MLEQILWVERYRPKTIQACILPERLKTPFQKYVEEKTIPNLLLTGTTGVGKTTVAKAMCHEVGCDYMVINGSDESGIDTFRTKIKNYASSLALSGGRKVILIDEADYLNPNSTQPALRNAIEEFAQNCSFIFTCNFKNRIIEPLHSRCAVIEFSLKNIEKPKIAVLFLKRLEEILKKESITYDKNVLIEVIKRFFPDLRRMINELQRFSQCGNIDVGLLSQIQDVELTQLAAKLKEKDFGFIRKWVASTELDPTTFYRKLYDNLHDLLKPESIPQAVLILADYSYKGHFVADIEIHLVAMLTELMASCEFL